MSAISFDTLETQLATKADVVKIDKDIAKLDKEITLVKWVAFATFAIVAIPQLKHLFA
ncbi:hypothetical protein [Thiomicrospira microaerophila]|uniref:hypothetical protein n=1 Tax=Thiomicrospira microaerophila TaxID=406020 RepID=UPI0012FE6065|nr:hypothetical protein [Thiomicrospira microaerophila]